MESKVLKVPLRLRDLSVAVLQAGVPLKVLFSSRTVEIKTEDLIQVVYGEKQKMLFASFWQNGREAELLFQGDCEATEILRPYAKVSEQVRPFDLRYWGKALISYLPNSASIILIVFALAFSVLISLTQFPGPNLFEKSNCNVDCAQALSGMARSLLIVFGSLLLGTLVPVVVYFRAKKRVKHWTTFNAIKFEVFSLLLVALFADVIFAQNLQVPSTQRGLSAFAKWHRGEEVRVKAPSRGSKTNEPATN